MQPKRSARQEIIEMSKTYIKEHPNPEFIVCYRCEKRAEWWLEDLMDIIKLNGKFQFLCDQHFIEQRATMNVPREYTISELFENIKRASQSNL